MSAMLYLGMVWDRSNASQVLAAKKLCALARQYRPTWRVVVDQPGLFVSLRPSSAGDVDLAYVLSLNLGVIIGRVFDADYAQSEASLEGAPRRVTFDTQTSTHVCSEGGNLLRDKYWGRYVAFLRHPTTEHQWVLRDPSGQTPCHCATVLGISVYFARVAELEVLNPQPLQINRHYFIGRVVLANAFSGETGYLGVSTLLPGERAEHVAGTLTKTFYWNAVQLASTEHSVDVRTAESETRKLVRASVFAWASCFDSILLLLSGGVDSSIIAACLASAPTRPRVLAFNSHFKKETSDERVFAQEVARLHGFDLIENETHLGVLNFSRPLERTVAPVPIEDTSSGWADICLRLNTEGYLAHFRGEGGDELFHRATQLPDATDYAFHHGLRPKLWSIAMNDALIARRSVWAMLRLSLSYGFFRRQYDWRALGSRAAIALFSAGARREAIEDETLWHPLYRGNPNCPPGKLDQAYSLLRYTMRDYAPSPMKSPQIVIMPLLSQPHMEFALRTPLHVLRAGARDRARARAAFSDCVPSKILNRRYKGLFTQPDKQRVENDMEEVRQLLLNGYLVKEGIVDRGVLEDVLAKEGLSASMASHVLKACIDSEVWIRNSIERDSHEAPRLDRHACIEA